ncbi:phosphatidylinositol-specific phospholipase C [Kitasatospora atroaurantiaca]|uniref:1-phosphatidylinositol phosphodiesterase n=1 Tax=Kitasatospora atroaurantiaca TaxID=285545 RepID=A0A561F0S4_9ACTN|nr:phosphatidylinositol-specific phospholipase C [Kitasatospora atroaurantiaca]TWE21467.1 1-phosphatidylinositol phosphodiesterase [Kitasatospora atroaurantiaca]
MDLTDTPISRRTFARSTVVLAAVGAGLGPSVQPARAADVPGGADWLGAVSSDTYLSQLTVPGTHDTCSLYGGAITQTQTLSLPDQLAAGVRFLDIRCRAIDGVFAIHHGSFFQHIFFGDVLNLCRAFLAQHPGETLLMRVKQEYSTVPAADFAAIFAGYRSKWPDLFWAEDRVPRLGEVRGRVVVLADSSGLPGIPWGGGRMDIEDDYQIGTIFELNSRKWPEVSAHLNAARASSDPQRLFLTFTSSSGWGLWPQQAAQAIAPKLSGYVSALNAATRPHLGTVPMDFVTPATVRPLYALNFAG